VKKAPELIEAVVNTIIEMASGSQGVNTTAFGKLPPIFPKVLPPVKGDQRPFATSNAEFNK